MESAATQRALSPAPTVDQIDRAIEDIVQLARSEINADRFYSALTERLVTATAGIAAAVWSRQSDGTLKRRTEFHSTSDQPISSETDRIRVVRQAAAAGRESVELLAGQNGNADAANCLQLTAPLIRDNETTAVLELLHEPDLSPPATEGCRQILAEFRDVALEYETAAELRELQRQRELWSRYEQFVGRIHGSLDLRETAFAIVNEGRTLIGCDRASLLIASGSGCRTLAVSGTDTLNRRSTTLRSLEPLAAAVVRMREPLWYDESTESNPPQVEVPLQQYLEASPARAMGIVPLSPPEVEEDRSYEPPFAALVVEHFDAQWEAESRQRAGAVAQLVRSALANALRYRAAKRWPVVGGLIAGSGLQESSPGRKWLAAGAVLVVLFAALWLIPADFEVSARGELLPSERRNVFAPSDGIVRLTNTAVRDRGDVRRDAVVAELRNPELERELTRVLGELATSQKQLDAVATARRRNERDGSRTKEDDQSLAARERELIQKRDNLRRDRDQLKSRAEDLKVRSPLSGQILTWDVVHRLDGRPVRRGDVLMRVAKLEGPWELELQLPEREAGYVRDAQRGRREPIAVSFQSANDPGRVHHGRVKSVAKMADVSKDGAATVRVVVSVDDPSELTLRPGATVTARFDCGRKPVGYVWFHDIIDTARGWLSW